jgi:enamine deaminase RidA (YjgF/YER057c/UK114 family)
MTLVDNVIRTWWFVRNIDANYQGLVDARRSHFSSHGLTEETHYIASTGIDGEHPITKVDISLDSYAISGLSQAQIEFLNAPEHLGPTHRYGVTFERATAVSYKDRRQVFISGTASIDPAGNIVYPGDVIRQLDRALENIGALLSTANASLSDLAMILVYLRDPADCLRIGDRIQQRLDHLPVIILLAPVCRPGWLVEVEGIAIISTYRPEFPDF